ncbi:MAG: chromate efflux transporter [Anaerolineales bacterium]|jgi:chromate transporter
MHTQEKSTNLREVAALFLKLGATAFGGPAAHIAMMHAEVVEKRQWLTEEEYLDLLGATNLIPGPNSTEMAIHLSFLRAGWPGLIIGGISFIAPAMLIVGLLAWVYIEYSTLPETEWLLYGVKPVVIAIILNALWKLGKKAVKSRITAAAGAAALILAFLNINLLLVLLLVGVAVMVASNFTSFKGSPPGGGKLPALLLPLGSTGLFQLAARPFSLELLFLTFLKIGSVLYGSGYVLLAFLNTDFVTRFGWLTNQQLVDAVAIGQVTPGPVFTTATFIGYLLGGTPGALLATAGIFLPSFIFVALSNRLIPRMRDSTWVGGFLDGVNVAALALMAAVTWQLGQSSLVDLLSTGVGILSLLLLIYGKVNSTLLIFGGAVIGLAASLLLPA